MAQDGRSRGASRRASAPGPKRGSEPSATGAARAISLFLDAMGLPPDVRGSEALALTPKRVADAWLGDLLDGYRRDPAAILGDAIPARKRDLVAVTGIDFHSVCPHHLLPSRGVAHVAYVPGDRIAGFGQLVQLVDALAHRFVLQEELARGVAEALMRHLGARGAACVLDAEQLCMTVRGGRRPHARAHTDAFLGVMARDARLQRRFLRLLGRTTARR